MEPVVFDNLSSGHEWALRWGKFERGDLADPDAIRAVLARHDVRAVIHFAALIQVGESVTDPSKYFRANFVNTLNLLDAMVAAGVREIVFSSSAAVYGDPIRVPIDEDHPVAPLSPYGDSKLMIEKVLARYERAYGVRLSALRYFNAAGADPGGELGEAHPTESHLIPLALQAALGRGRPLSVFGTDYPTPDGTAVRDYVHVNDLAAAHVAALRHLAGGGASFVANVGIGRGYSVREVLATVEKFPGCRCRTSWRRAARAMPGAGRRRESPSNPTRLEAPARGSRGDCRSRLELGTTSPARRRLMVNIVHYWRTGMKGRATAIRWSIWQSWAVCWRRRAAPARRAARTTWIARTRPAAVRSATSTHPTQTCKPAGTQRGAWTAGAQAIQTASVRLSARSARATHLLHFTKPSDAPSGGGGKAGTGGATGAAGSTAARSGARRQAVGRRRRAPAGPRRRDTPAARREQRRVQRRRIACADQLAGALRSRRTGGRGAPPTARSIDCLCPTGRSPSGACRLRRAGDSRQPAAGQPGDDPRTAPSRKAASRAELAKATGMSKPTTGKIIDDLVAAGVVEEVKLVEAGAPASAAPASSCGWRPAGRISWSWTWASSGRASPRCRPAARARAVAGAVQDAADRRSLAGTGGPGRREGRHQAPVGGADQHVGRGRRTQGARVAVAEPALVRARRSAWMVRQVWPAPVGLVQNVRALALGELGARSDNDDFLLVDIAEGVGGALMLGGRLIRDRCP